VKEESGGIDLSSLEEVGEHISSRKKNQSVGKLHDQACDNRRNQVVTVIVSITVTVIECNSDS
jgi:hypothetical protein